MQIFYSQDMSKALLLFLFHQCWTRKLPECCKSPVKCSRSALIELFRMAAKSVCTLALQKERNVSQTRKREDDTERGELA